MKKTKTLKLMLTLIFAVLGSISGWAQLAFTNGQEIKVASIPEYVFQVVGNVENTKTSANVQLVGRQEGIVAADIINDQGEIYFPGEFEYSVGSKVYTMKVVGFDGEVFNDLPTAGSIVIPKWVQTIPNYAFKGDTELGTITFASGSRVTSIGEHCFTTTKIYEFDFSPCNYLEELPNQVFVEDGEVNSFITKVTLPTSPYFKHINGAFQRMEALTTIVNLENSYVKELIGEAFTGCKALKSLSLGIRMRYVDQEALKGSVIENLSIKVGDKDVIQDAGIVLLGGVKVLRNPDVEDVNEKYVYIPTADTELAATKNLYGFNVVNNQAGTSATPLKNLTLTGKLTGKISSLAFAWCDLLNETLDLTGMQLGSTGQILTDAFQNCYFVNGGYQRGITTVKVGDISNNTSGGYTVDSKAFEGCQKLETVEIGNISTIDAIGHAAFGKWLKKVTIGSVETTGASFASQTDAVDAIEAVLGQRATYEFTSFGISDEPLATGTVTAVQGHAAVEAVEEGEEDIDAVPTIVTVRTNSVGPEAGQEGSWIGREFALDYNAQANDDKYWELYDKEEGPTGIFVKVGNKTDAVPETYSFHSYVDVYNELAEGTVYVNPGKVADEENLGYPHLAIVKTNSLDENTWVGKQFYLDPEAAANDGKYWELFDTNGETGIFVKVGDKVDDAKNAVWNFGSTFATAAPTNVYAEDGTVEITGSNNYSTTVKVTDNGTGPEDFKDQSFVVYVTEDDVDATESYELYSTAAPTATGIFVELEEGATPDEYDFTSYASAEATDALATGTVEVLDQDTEAGTTTVIVTYNSVDGFEGNVYVVNATEIPANGRLELYSAATGVSVTGLTENTPAEYAVYNFTSYAKGEPHNLAEGTVTAEKVTAIEVVVTTNTVDNDTWAGQSFYLTSDAVVADEEAEEPVYYELFEDEALATSTGIFVTVDKQLTEADAEALATYSFTSYAKNGDNYVELAKGVVTAEEIHVANKVTVYTNSVDEETWKGKSFFVEPIVWDDEKEAAQQEFAGEYFELYDANAEGSKPTFEESTGIFVTIDAKNEATPETYDFTSYGLTQYATGVVYATQTGEYTHVEVKENSVEGFVGNTYVLDADAEAEDGEYWQLSDQRGETGIYVQIGKKLSDAVEPQPGVESKEAQDAAFVWKKVPGTELSIAKQEGGVLNRRAAEINDDGSAAIPTRVFDFTAITGLVPTGFVYPTIAIGDIDSKGGVFADGAIMPADKINKLTFEAIAENGLDAAIIRGENYAGLDAITFNGAIGKGGIATGAFANLKQGQVKTLTFNGVMAGVAVSDGAFNYPVFETEAEAEAMAKAKTYKVNYTAADVADFAVNPFAKNAFVKNFVISGLLGAAATADVNSPRYIMLSVANEALSDQYADEDWGLKTDKRFDIYLVLQTYVAPEPGVTERNAFLVYRNNNTKKDANANKFAWGRYDLGSFANEKPYPTYGETSETTYEGVYTNMWIDRFQEINKEVIKVTLYGVYTDEDFTKNGQVSTVYMVPLEVQGGRYMIESTNDKLVIVKAEKKDGSVLTGDFFNEFDIKYDVKPVVESSVWNQLPSLRTYDDADWNIIGKSQGLYTNQQMWDGVSTVPSIWEGARTYANANKTPENKVAYADKALYVLLDPSKHKGFDVEKTTITKSIAPGVDANLPNGRNGGYINKNWYYALLHEFAPVEPKMAEETAAPARVIWLDEDEATAIFGVNADAIAENGSQESGLVNIQGVAVDESYVGLVIDKATGKKFYQNLK